MTVFKRPTIFRDKIKVGEDELLIEFCPQDIAAQYYTLLRQLIGLEKIMENPTEKTSTEYAECVIKLMCIVFGAENAQKILEYYEGNYAHMVDAVVPYMCLKVAPTMRSTSKAMRRKLKMKL